MPKFPQRKTILEYENLQRKQYIRILLRQGQAHKLELKVKDALLTCFQNIFLLPSFCFIWEELSANIYKAVLLLHFKFFSESEG